MVSATPHSAKVFSHISALERIRVADLDSEVGGIDPTLTGDLAVPHLDRRGRRTDRDLVEAVLGVHNKCMARAEIGQCGGHQPLDIGPPDSNHLALDPRRVCQRTEQIEDCPDTQGSPDRHDCFHRRVETWSKKKCDTHFVVENGHHFRRGIEYHARGLEHIGGTAAR